MTKRPLSVSIIGWFLAVTGVLAGLGVAMTPNNETALRMYAHSPLPLSVHMAIGVVGAIATVVSGWGMLKGFNWSRFLYAGWSLISFVISFATVPIPSLLIFGLLFVAVILFFLFRPDANAWFRGPAEARD